MAYRLQIFHPDGQLRYEVKQDSAQACKLVANEKSSNGFLGPWVLLADNATLMNHDFANDQNFVIEEVEEK